jgi:hypothetical protein
VPFPVVFKAPAQQDLARLPREAQLRFLLAFDHLAKFPTRPTRNSGSNRCEAARLFGELRSDSGGESTTSMASRSGSTFLDIEAQFTASLKSDTDSRAAWGAIFVATTNNRNSHANTSRRRHCSVVGPISFSSR